MATETTGAQVKLRAVEMDHIVLRVKDVERALHFYTEIIGLAPYRVEEYRSGKVPFPCARINGHTIIDLLPWTQDEPVGDGPRNMDHFCLTIEPIDLVGLAESLKGQGVTVVSEGPALRSGAQGTGNSIYVKDWEGNTIELRYY